jgi:stage V sporulation protein SpoVS
MESFDAMKVATEDPVPALAAVTDKKEEDEGVPKPAAKRQRTPRGERPPRTNEQSFKDRVHSDPSFNEMKVSTTTDTKRLAGALAHVAREHREMKIAAISPPNVNTAVKAVAIAREYIKDETMDVGLVVKFRDDTRRDIDMRYATFDSRFTIPGDSHVVYAVGKSSTASSVSGVVAARIREDIRPVLSCIGAGSVFRAVTALCLASEYIRRETEKKSELLIVPYFVNEIKGETTVTTLNLCVVKIDA